MKYCIECGGHLPDGHASECAYSSSDSSRCSAAVDLIAAERARQTAEEGWTTEHDDGHDRGQLAIAASCYAFPNSRVYEMAWPWESEWYKRTPHNRIRELVKAGALIVAEIERIQRQDSQ